MMDTNMMTAFPSRLGPPPFLAPMLKAFNDGIQRHSGIVSELSNLPLTSAIRVRTKSGLQVNLQFQLQQIGDKWQEVCQRSDIIPRGFGAYGSFVDHHLLKPVEMEATSTESMFDTCKALATVYREQASSFLDEVQSVITEISVIIASLEKSVGIIRPNLIAFESVNKSEVVGISDGILSILLADVVEDAFDASSIISTSDDTTLATLRKDNPLIQAPFQSIHQATMTIGVSRTVDEIKKAVARSQDIAKWLQSQLPKLEEIYTLTVSTADAWHAVHDGLGGLNQRTKSVNRLSIVQDTSSPPPSWQEVRQLARPYTALGVHAAVSTVAVFDASGQSDDSGALKAFFAAPAISGRILTPQDLSQLTQEYVNASRALYNISQDDIAGESDRIGRLINDSALPTSSIAGAALKQFASRQPEIPSLPIEWADWESFCNIRMPQVQDGAKKVQDAYDAIFNLQSKSSDLNVNIRSRIAELGITLDRVRRSIDEKRNERARQEELFRQFPLAWAIKRLIDQLSGEIERLEEEDRMADRYIRSLTETRNTTSSVGERVSGLTNLTTGMSRFWLDLQVVMNTANVVWPILHKLKKLPQEEIDLYKKTWNAVMIAVQEW